MKLFEDVISNDEMFSDAFPMLVRMSHSLPWTLEPTL